MTNWAHLRRYLGSSVAWSLGGLLLIGGIAAGGAPGTVARFDASPWSSIVAGVVLLLGGLAYRSAKKRRLGEAGHPMVRTAFEALSLVFLCAIVFLQPDLPRLIAVDPVVNLIAPVWALVAYAVVTLWPRRVMA